MQFALIILLNHTYLFSFLLSGVAYCNTSENGCELCPIKVLDSRGSGSSAGVIAGIDKTTADCQSLTNTKCVLNMSLGGGFYSVLNTAVNNAVAAGVTVVVAAGNSSADACNESPARVPEAITVGSTTQYYAAASCCNYGSCVDWWPPG